MAYPQAVDGKVRVLADKPLSVFTGNFDLTANFKVAAKLPPAPAWPRANCATRPATASLLPAQDRRYGPVPGAVGRDQTRRRGVVEACVLRSAPRNDRAEFARGRRIESSPGRSRDFQSPHFVTRVSRQVRCGRRQCRMSCRRPISSSALQKLADGPRGLANALFVLHQRETHVSFAQRAEADARRNRHQRLLQQQLRKFQRSAWRGTAPAAAPTGTSSRAAFPPAIPRGSALTSTSRRF